MEINEFNERLKSGNLSGAYLFAGEEDYLKKFYLGRLRAAIVTDESFALFNHAVFDGEKMDFAAMTDAVKSPPMMSDFKLVEWRYPSLASMKESELSALEELLRTRAEYGYTAIAFIVSEDGVDLGTGKRKSKFVSRFEDKLSIIRLDRSTDAQLAQWIRRHLDSEGVQYERDLPAALIFRSGHSMQILKEEIDKLSALAGARGRALTTKDVEEVCTATTECDTFALSNALLAQDKRGALVALSDMKAKRIDPAVIIGMMAKVVCDLVGVARLTDEGMSNDDIAKSLSMNPYKLKLYTTAAKKLGQRKLEQMLAELSHTDSSSKSGGIVGYTAIELYVMQNM